MSAAAARWTNLTGGGGAPKISVETTRDVRASSFFFERIFVVVQRTI